MHRGKHAWRLRESEIIRAQPVDHRTQLAVLLVPVPRVVSRPSQRFNLLHCVAENEDVLLAHRFADFHIGSVKGADGQCAIQGELHVSRAGGLLTGRGDLFRDVRGGNDLLRQRNPVIGQKHHLQPAVDPRIRVDAGADRVDGLDDVLRHVVTRGGLRGKNEHPGNNLLRRILQHAPVEREDVQQVQMLALVFVQPLDLHIEDRLRRHLQTSTFGADHRRQILFVGTLDRHEFLLEARIVRPLFELAELLQIAHPARAQPVRDHPRQPRIALQQPPARRDPVGLVVEFAREQGVELREEIAPQQLGVQRRHAVDGVRGRHGEVRHTHHLVAVLLDQGAGPLFQIVPRPLLLAGHHQLRIDFKDELEVARQDPLKQGHTPSFECLRQQRVIRVTERPRDDRPGLLPRQTVFVDQDAQQLHDGDGRMRVVELDGNLVREVVPGICRLFSVAADDVPERTGDEEILLHQTQLPSVLRLVVWIQNLGDGFPHRLLPDRFDITTLIEGREVELLGGLGRPEAEEIHGRGAVPGNGNVVGHPEQGLRVGPARPRFARPVGDLLHLAVELDSLCIFGADDLPRIAEDDPVVRVLHLLAIDELLFEQAVFVMDAVADRRIVVRGKRIQEARRETTKSAVPQRHVFLSVAQRREIQAEIAHRRHDGFRQAGAMEIGLQQAAHEILQREVIDPAHVVLIVHRLGGQESREDVVPHGHRRRDPPIAHRGRAGIPRQRVFQVPQNGLFDQERGRAGGVNGGTRLGERGAFRFGFGESRHGRK